MVQHSCVLSRMSGANDRTSIYGKHASKKHHLDCRMQCLFCFGRKQWPHGQRNRPENVNHVTACLQRFVEDAKEESEEEETVEDEEACGCRDF
ncbi:uncharacterized protein TNCV_1718141 [Trichonephila clavipes]|nr:uncharacterized protein TNCV_1718141 [Trichonephila clavipes]